MFSFDEPSANELQSHPTESILSLEKAVLELAKELFPAEEIHNIQVQLSSQGELLTIRSLESHRISKLVRINGIVISASTPIAKPTNVYITCKPCLLVVTFK